MKTEQEIMREITRLQEFRYYFKGTYRMRNEYLKKVQALCWVLGIEYNSLERTKNVKT